MIRRAPAPAARSCASLHLVRCATYLEAGHRQAPERGSVRVIAAHVLLRALQVVSAVNPTLLHAVRAALDAILEHHYSGTQQGHVRRSTRLAIFAVSVSCTRALDAGRAGASARGSGPSPCRSHRSALARIYVVYRLCGGSTFCGAFPAHCPLQGLLMTEAQGYSVYGHAYGAYLSTALT
jgi:hypothetical protein